MGSLVCPFNFTKRLFFQKNPAYRFVKIFIVRMLWIVVIFLGSLITFILLLILLYFTWIVWPILIGAVYVPTPPEIVEKMLIFAGVNGANVRLYSKTGSHRWIAALGVIVCLSALGALVWQRVTASPKELWILGVMVGLAFAIETLYRGVTGRIIRRPLMKGSFTLK